MYYSSNDHKALALCQTSRGIAVLASASIKKGERVASFDGTIYSWTGVRKTIPNEPPRFSRDHAIQFEEYRARDSFGVARYFNHSCNPNCGIRNLFDLTAMRDIMPGEELCWDYDMTEDSFWRMHCECGSPHCRRIIGGYRFLPPGFRSRYEGFISGWLLHPPRPFVGGVLEAMSKYPYPVVPTSRDKCAALV